MPAENSIYVIGVEYIEGDSAIKAQYTKIRALFGIILYRILLFRFFFNMGGIGNI